jgi:4-hydroxy-tetrahydrodipicolinate synthase
MFHGSMVALVTPMHENGAIDFDSLANLIEWHIESGSDALVILGTTGESATINFNERAAVLKFVMEQTRDSIPLIAGTGTNSTSETIKLTRHAMEVGVDASLLVTPYYNKPTQEGMVQHYLAVANSVAMPLILYNVPSRTGCDLLPETVYHLAKVPNIIGLKEATGDIKRVNTLLELCDDNIDLYSGDDISSLDFMLAGGKGIISVTANVAPQVMREMCQAVLDGEIEKANDLQNRLMPLHKQLFVESNPIPVKWVLQEMGKIKSGIRLPLTILESSHHQSVRTAMQQAGVT